MAFHFRTEHGSSSTTPKNYEEMSISDLVYEMRAAYQAEEFDKVEEVLVSRDTKLKAEIVSLRQKFELERLTRVEAEEKVRKREEEYEKGVKSREIYEKLLRKVKENGVESLADKTTIEKLRQKNNALEQEICVMKELEKKWLEDDNSLVQLRDKVRVMEEGKVVDKSVLDALRMKNSELEESVKKNLTTIEKLEAENGKLTDEKCRCEASIESLERKFRELCDRVVKMEDDVQLLMSLDSSGCGNNEVEPDPGVTCAVKEEKDFGDDYELKNDNGEPDSFRRNGDICNSLGAGNASKGKKDALLASAGSRSKPKKVEVINLDDDDDDDIKCTSQGLHGKKSIRQIIAENAHPSSSDAVQHKRKLDDIETSSSTSISSADTLDLDDVPLSSRAIASEKRSKILAFSSGFNSLPRKMEQ